MNIFNNFFTTFLYQPLLNILILLYIYLPGQDFGIAVIFLTLITKIILWPAGKQAIISQKTLISLQPKLKEIKDKYKNNKEEEIKATLELYKKEKINPFLGCLPILIQVPILIALYQVFWKGFEAEQMKYLYSFVPNPGQINFYFLNLFDLSKPNIYLAILAGIFQFIQLKTATPKNPDQTKKSFNVGDLIQTQMIYFFPVFTIYILLNLPSAIGLYWTTLTIFSIIQQYFVYKKIFI